MDDEQNLSERLHGGAGPPWQSKTDALLPRYETLIDEVENLVELSLGIKTLGMKEHDANIVVLK